MKPVVLLLLMLASTGAVSREEIAVTEPMRQEASDSIRAVLKDPDSAKFSDFKAYSSDGKVDICGKVNARNGYGGYAGAEWFAAPSGMAPVIFRSDARSRNAGNSIVKVLCGL